MLPTSKHERKLKLTDEMRASMDERHQKLQSNQRKARSHMKRSADAKTVSGLRRREVQVEGGSESVL